MLWFMLLAVASGMRTLTPVAVVSWAAYLGYLPVEHTWAFWLAKLVSPIVFSVLALGEYAGDTLPQTPSRTEWPLVAGRLGSGVFVGVTVMTALGEPKASGVLFGVVGALLGTYGGYRARMALARWVGSDLPVALAESALSLGISMDAVWHMQQELAHYSNQMLNLRWR